MAISPELQTQARTQLFSSLSRSIGTFTSSVRGKRPPGSREPGTDFCIVGFPKCGTTALARFFEANEKVHLAKLNDRYESPYFKTGRKDPAPDYRAGFVNGHKFTGYAYSLHALQRLYGSSPDALYIFCVRDAKAAMLSWHRMHSKIAARGTPERHPVNRSSESRAFFQTCSAEAYFERYADRRLDYAEAIGRFLKALPQARFVVTSQGRLAQDAAGLMATLLGRLGIEPSAEYLADLPKRHDSYGQRAETEITPEVVAALAKKDRQLFALLDSLPPEQNLTLRQPDIWKRSGWPEDAL